VGSNPTRRAILQENPIKPWFVEALEYQNTTLLQLYKDFIETDTTYLQKIKNIYYLVYKYKGKIIKKSLRSSNLKYCNIQKLKIIQVLKKELGLGFNKITDDMLTIHIKADKGDSSQSVQNVKEEAIKEASKQLALGEIKNINVISPLDMTIKKAFEEYKDNLIKTKKPSKSTLENCDSAYAYLKLFIDEEEDILKLDNRFWTTLQSNLIETPRDFLKTKRLLEIGIYEAIRENENIKKELEYQLKNSDKNLSQSLKSKYEKNILSNLTSQTINKHFATYSNIMKYIENIGLMDNTLKITPLEEEESNKHTFLYKELKELFNFKSTRKDSNGYEDSEYQNMYKFAFLSGMRRGEILKITKDSFVEANGVKCIDILEAKNKQSLRLVPISKEMEEIIRQQLKHSKNGYLFFDKEIRYRRRLYKLQQ